MTDNLELDELSESAVLDNDTYDNIFIFALLITEKMRRYTIQLLLVSLSWFGLTTSCTHREARFRIGVSQCSDDEWRHQMNNEMLREALFYDGVEIDIRTVKDDNAEQIKDIRNFIKEGVDLLVVAPNEAAPITPVVEEAFDRGIPVIVFDRKILSDKLYSQDLSEEHKSNQCDGQPLSGHEPPCILHLIVA